MVPPLWHRVGQNPWRYIVAQPHELLQEVAYMVDPGFRKGGQ